MIETKDSATWPFCLSVAREFYLFWTQDIKAIAALVADDGFDLDIEEWQPPDCDLQTLWSRLEKIRIQYRRNVAVEGLYAGFASAPHQFVAY